jgi:hypothetical protein
VRATVLLCASCTNEVGTEACSMGRTVSPAAAAYGSTWRPADFGGLMTRHSRRVSRPGVTGPANPTLTRPGRYNAGNRGGDEIPTSGGVPNPGGDRR